MNTREDAVVEILRVNPPWLYAPEICSIFNMGAQKARAAHMWPVRVAMALADTPPTIGKATIYTLLSDLEEENRIRAIILTSGNCLEQFTRRWPDNPAKVEEALEAFNPDFPRTIYAHNPFYKPPLSPRRSDMPGNLSGVNHVAR